ncbi:hypothetical protein C8J56DRAFT_1057828 [Mycena floridula]|nr:hypothetical protein C8J56DRAFT_1057828 [Mycena floridula]
MDDQETKNINPKGKYAQTNAKLANSAKKRKRSSGLVEKFKDCGHWFARAANPFLSVEQVLTVSCQLDGLKGVTEDDELDEDEELTEEEQLERAHQIKAHRAMLSQTKELKGYLEHLHATNDIEGFKVLAQTIQKSSNKARIADTSSIRDGIIPMIPFDDSETPAHHIYPNRNKSGQGMNNVAIAAWFTPFEHIDDVFTEDNGTIGNETIAKIQNHEIPLLSSEVPAFLYDITQHDSSNMCKGLFKNHILVRVLRSILHRASAAMTGKKHKATCKSNGQIHKIRKCSPELLAYTAILVRFTLSNKESWGIRDGLFKLDEFYYFIVDILNNPKQACWAKATLDWWNREIFGESTETKNNDAPESSGKSGFAALMDLEDEDEVEATGITADIDNNLDNDEHQQSISADKPLQTPS